MDTTTFEQYILDLSCVFRWCSSERDGDSQSATRGNSREAESISGEISTHIYTHTQTALSY